ncbi:uncharacterized protein K444DRAFT_205823 [Hyaloscypha bicolor E]|uniref:Uncharacterized protein n=1 Tax=Hyaloscypha bicolor E TaxID=1095630 RepID=A0A2J6TP36_9HELO|nr:uncharacterized protein K444DRAFT_205823 [Hyaloscypha bicolor E]PMD64787.1 hypothetical protein K444DRAFT_205823 [Hyaloscypha bicolor E]
MAMIGKFAGAAVSATTEATLALANISFDFSILKIEGPLEYHGLGNALSTQRRYEAEDGSIHVTARKLGALFDEAIPEIPQLIKSYGRRASEVAASPKINPKGTRDDGFLANHIGADGTNIWAAATSGKGAIAVHLLACMLARIWSASEAVSIWAELLAERKKELSSRQEDSSNPFSATSAVARVSVTRDQLRIWDNGARSWLQSADKALERKHLQILLIVNNVNLPVNRDMDVYNGVMRAWSTALTTTELLLNGKPQRVQDGAVLLGLISWHLYPNILVLGSKTTEVDQRDPLIPREGILTVGLKSTSPDRDHGVFWSLPLAHLRFYGDPVRSLRSLATDTGRISFDELSQVILGSALYKWSDQAIDVLQAANLLITLGKYLQEVSEGGKLIPPWLTLLVDAATRFSEAKDISRDSYLRLFAFGQRRARTFLAAAQFHPSPVFGLSMYSTIFSLLPEEEDWISILRQIASNLAFDPCDIFIRVAVPSISQLVCRNYYEYATLLPYPRTSVKRNQLGSERQTFDHVRWIVRASPRDRGDEIVPEDSHSGPEWITVSHSTSKCTSTCGNVCGNDCPCRLSHRKCTVDCHKARFIEQSLESMTCSNLPHNTRQFQLEIEIARRHAKVIALGESAREVNPNDIEDTSDLIFWWARNGGCDVQGNGDDRVNYKLLFGDPDSAAIFLRQDKQPKRSIASPTEHMNTPKALLGVLDTKRVNPNLLLQYLRGLTSSDTEGVQQGNFHRRMPEDEAYRNGSLAKRYFNSLLSLVAAKNLYENLPGATIDLNAATKCVSRFSWVRDRADLDTSFLTRAQSFACIANFESGGIDLDPDSLRNVMALSAGNSLFVAAALLRDPSVSLRGQEIRRLTGNIGKAGLALLVPPARPRIRSYSPSTWQQITHASFDGKASDSFQSTSLHLSFTEYELPVDTGSHGGRERQAFFVEALVSVHDKGEWVADLDILGALGSARLHRFPLCPTDTYDTEAEYWNAVRKKEVPGGIPYHDKTITYDKQQLSGHSLVSIDNWEELLDPPSHISIIRAHNNWCGRLAAAAVSIQQSCDVWLLPKTRRICWRCFYKMVEDRTNASIPSKWSVYSDTEGDLVFKAIFTENASSESGDDESDTSCASDGVRPMNEDDGKPKMTIIW